MKNILDIKILDLCTHILKANRILTQSNKRSGYFNSVACRTTANMGVRTQVLPCIVSGVHLGFGKHNATHLTTYLIELGVFF